MILEGEGDALLEHRQLFQSQLSFGANQTRRRSQDSICLLVFVLLTITLTVWGEFIVSHGSLQYIQTSSGRSVKTAQLFVHLTKLRRKGQLDVCLFVSLAKWSILIEQ